ARLALLGLLGLARAAGRGALDVVTRPQPVLANLSGGNRDVGGGPPVAGRPQESAAVGEVNDPGNHGGDYRWFCFAGFFHDCGHGVSSQRRVNSRMLNRTAKQPLSCADAWI